MGPSPPWSATASRGGRPTARRLRHAGHRWLRGHLDVVERDGTVWEVLDRSLAPYRGRLNPWRADEAMLWGAMLAGLEQRAGAGEARDGSRS